MDLFDAIYTARTIRRLKPDPIPDDVITRVLDAAIRAGSANNNQNWVFLVVTDSTVRTKLGDIYRKGAEGLRYNFEQGTFAPHVSAGERERHYASARHLMEHFHEAPVILIPCIRPVSTEPVPAAMKDYINHLTYASIFPAIQNIVLACREFGLATVLTTVHMLFEDEVRRATGIPADVQTFAMMPIGYPEDPFRRILRLPVRKVAFRDRWNNPWK